MQSMGKIKKGSKRDLERQETLSWVKGAAGGATDLYLGYMAGKGGLSWDELTAIRKAAGRGKDRKAGHLSDAFFDTSNP
jgi:hypothetical protein